MVPRREQPDDLDPRAREVLREIVMQYVGDGEPVSSRSLARCGRFQLSPATLRNVMADLEDLGYVYQPHTSAGRVPTDRGYRFFIDRLMKSRRLTQHEREVIDDEVGRVDELDEVMHLASRLLSKLSDQVGVVFMPKIHQLVMRSINFVQITDTKILCVIVGTNGVVVNKIIETRAGLSRDDLERIGRYLSAEFGGKTLETAHGMMQRAIGDSRCREDDEQRNAIGLGLDAVEDAMPSEHELFVEGTTSILRKPEFAADSEAMRRMVSAIEERDRLIAILSECLDERGLQILVGSESSFTRMHNVSLVATPYGSGAQPFGLVAVIGPTRMEYARMAPLVDYLGRALSRKIEESQQEQTS